MQFWHQGTTSINVYECLECPAINYVPDTKMLLIVAQCAFCKTKNIRIVSTDRAWQILRNHDVLISSYQATCHDTILTKVPNFTIHYRTDGLIDDETFPSIDLEPFLNRNFTSTNIDPMSHVSENGV